MRLNERLDVFSERIAAITEGATAPPIDEIEEALDNTCLGYQLVSQNGDRAIFEIVEMSSMNERGNYRVVAMLVSDTPPDTKPRSRRMIATACHLYICGELTGPVEPCPPRKQVERQGGALLYGQR